MIRRVRERIQPCPSPRRVDKPEPFEKNLARLDAIVHELEDTDLPLDKALVLYEEGMKLSEFCHKQLEEAEGRVEIMTRKAGGKMVAEPFRSGGDGRGGEIR